MSLFGSMLGDVEDDPFFGSHMRHMQQMNNMMNSMFSNPFGMLGGGMLGGPLALEAPGLPRSMSMMPMMPQMPSMNKLFSDLSCNMNAGSSYSSTVVMSSGMDGSPQVYSSTSSTKIGPNGIKETRRTLQDSRTGTKKMSVGHHIGSRAHVVEREHNVYSGDREERQEFINLDEDEADEFDREFQSRAGAYVPPPRRALTAAAAAAPPAAQPAAPLALMPPPSHTARAGQSPGPAESERERYSVTSDKPRPSARRPLRPAATGPSSAVREVYSGSHPQRQRSKHHKASRRAD